MSGDLSKLPKWAQKHIEGLERRTREAESKAEEARLATAPDASNTIVNHRHREPIGLGLNPTVEFFPKGHDDGWHQDHFNVRLEGHALKVMGGGQLVVLPQVTNVVRLELRRL